MTALKYTDPLAVYFYRRLDRLISRAYLYDLFTYQEWSPLDLTTPQYEQLTRKGVIPFPTPMEDNKLIVVKGPGKAAPVYAYVQKVKEESFLHYLKPVVVGEPLIHPRQTVELVDDLIANYTAKEKIITTFGRVTFNQVVLVEVFGNKIPYMNRNIDPGTRGDLSRKVAKLCLDKEITVAQARQYLDHAYHLGTPTEIATPAMTERSLTTHPDVPKVREAFIKANRDRLTDPAVFAELEKKLIALDMEWLKGDPALRFYYPLDAKRSINLQRRTMFLFGGGIEALDHPFDVIEGALVDGWQKREIVTYANQTRRASYFRGVETQKGGAGTKMIQRIFQDAKIVEPDCGTRRGLRRVITERIAKKTFRKVWENGQWVDYTPFDFAKIIGKTVVMRSPMYCNSKNGGYCQACMGGIISALGLTGLGPQAITITATFMNLAMKNMHGSTVDVMEIGPLDQYFITQQGA
jgi:hypothetical protein